MNGIVSVITPLLLHMLFSELVVPLLFPAVNSAMSTLIVSLIVIPIASWMFTKDRSGAGCRIRENGHCFGWKRDRDRVHENKKGRVKEEEYVGAPGSEQRKEYVPEQDCVQEKGRTGTLDSEQNPVHGYSRMYWFALFCFAAGGVLNIAWSSVLNFLGIQQLFSNETQEALLAEGLVLQVVSLGFFVPIAEELIFRALIYGRMKRFLPVKWAVFFSALLFALYHGNPIQVIFAFPMALALAGVYEYGGKFAYPVLFHMGANLTAVLVNFLT